MTVLPRLSFYSLVNFGSLPFLVCRLGVVSFVQGDPRTSNETVRQLKGLRVKYMKPYEDLRDKKKGKVKKERNKNKPLHPLGTTSPCKDKYLENVYVMSCCDSTHDRKKD